MADLKRDIRYIDRDFNQFRNGAKKMILNININIATSNSAFDEDMASEVQNILINQLKIEYLLPSVSRYIRDSNGNKVGSFTATFR